MRWSLCTALLGLCLLVGMGSSLQAAPGDGLAAVDLVYDFGCVGIDFDVFHTYRLTNNGKDTVRVFEIDANCDCSQIIFHDSVLAPGDTVDVRLQFNTKDYYGKTTRSAVVRSDDVHQPEFKIYYFSTVGQWLHKVVPDPVSLFFLPTQKTRTAAFTNTAMDRIELKGTDAADDVVEIEPIVQQANKGEQVKLNFTPRADLKPGTYLTSVRMSFAVSGVEQPLLVTLPVKIVRY